MTATARMSLAALLAVLAAGVPMFPLTKDRSYLFLALVLIAGSVMVALLARRIGVPEPVVRLLQLAPALVVPWLIPAAGNPVKLYRSTVEYVATAFARWTTTLDSRCSARCCCGWRIDGRDPGQRPGDAGVDVRPPGPALHHLRPRPLRRDRSRPVRLPGPRPSLLLVTGVATQGTRRRPTW